MTDFTQTDDFTPQASTLFNHDCEMLLLGGLLLAGSEHFEHVMPLTPQDFHDPRCMAVFRGFLKAYQDGKAGTVFDVAEALGDDEVASIGGFEFIQALASYWPSVAKMKRWGGMIRDMAATRRLLQALAEAQDVVMGDGDLESKIDQVQNLIAPVAAAQIRKVPRSLQEVIIEQTAHYEALSEGKAEAGWPTGIGGLDRLLSGGLRPGRMVVLAARPAVGKSSLAQWIAQNVALDGRKALFLSQEMDVADLANRAVASRGRVAMHRLMEGGPEPEEYARVVEVADDGRLANIRVDDQPALRLADIRAKARSIKGLSLLVVDYLQLMSGSNDSPARSQNRENEISVISRGLKALAMDLGVCVIALSQLNREVEKSADKRPNLSHLRESGAIEQDADVVGLMWPVRVHEDGSKLIGLTLAKNRIGRTGDLGLRFDGTYQRWAESGESLNQSAVAKSAEGIRD